MDKETEKKIQQLQLIEQNLQNFAMQKQQFQLQLLEIESALEELQKSKEAYKIVGGIMVSADKNQLNGELDSKKQLIELRLKNIEKQEKELKEKEKALRESALKRIQTK